MHRVLNTSREEVWGAGIVECFSYLSVSLATCGLLLTMLGLFVLYIMSAHKYENEFSIAEGVIQPRIALDYASLNPWIKLTARFTRTCYSTWHRCVTSIIPCFRDTTLAPAEPTHQRLEPHNALNHELVGQNASLSSGAREATSDYSRRGQSDETEVSRDSDHGVNPGLGGPSNEWQQNDGNDNDEGTELQSLDYDSTETEEPDIEAAELFLHIIIPAGLANKKQVPLQVTQYETDYDLAYLLNRVYRERRPYWRAIFMVNSVRPVKYELYNKTNVRIIDTGNPVDTMPDIFNRPEEYVFSYWPPMPLPEPPLLHSAQLTSLYWDPGSSVHEESLGTVHERQCFARSPKRKGRLRFMPNKGYPTGFGFEIVEKLNLRFILTCESLIAFIALLLTFLYLGLGKGEQKWGAAPTIGSFIFAVGQFLFAVIIVVIERCELWAY
ncbi:uncharacterized protein J4E87_009365 [Alternaria ethzedia]|uniref:uncharacterized protein n=1 Tax=Alternaria ethzedia TaxID=181014 RepID=UPI0020C4BDD9|nr:uncharacterized protein J4E87_009365 [Alternaria ethzedia]KAI4614770.1 hypothetical protein J4E87_009365 [Alternaria ethzedia]